MIYVWKPAANLADQIGICLFTERIGGDRRAVYDVLPSAYMTLMMRFSSSGCRSFLFGPVTTQTRLELDETSGYFCIRFLPGQAPRLADVHSSDLVDSHVELPNIFGADPDSLGERLLFSPSHTTRQSIVKELFRDTRPLVREDRCRRGAALMEASGGRLSVNDLAQHLGVHVRSVERSFLDHFGMSPKYLTRIIRLQHFIAHKRSGFYRNLADLAYVCGYSDQSHMIKDVKELTGRLPAEITTCQIRLSESDYNVQVSYV